jgi:hypothetical protein
MGPLGSAGYLPGSSYHPLYRRKSIAHRSSSRRSHHVVKLALTYLPILSRIEITLQSPANQSIQVFSMVISLVTIGSVIVTINAKLLGGRV